MPDTDFLTADYADGADTLRESEHCGVFGRMDSSLRSE